MKDRVTSLTAILIIVFIAILLFAGIFAYWQYENYKTPIVASPQAQTTAQISEQDAIDLVKNLPEVKSWLALFNQPDGTSSIGGKPVIEVDHQDSAIYVVHAYEWVNQGADSHTATEGWYDVDKKTGEIKSEF